VPRHEWHEQVRLAVLLDKWLDDTCTFWTATDPVAASALAGVMRKKRGVRSGVPDVFVLYRRRLFTIELKSRIGRCSPAQKAVREALLRAGAVWWVCRTAYAAMWALHRSGVRFRTLTHADGTQQRWRQPRLEPWEVPRRDPAEQRPLAPEERAYRREWRQKKRERLRLARAEAAEAGNGAAEADGEAAEAVMGIGEPALAEAAHEAADAPATVPTRVGEAALAEVQAVTANAHGEAGAAACAHAQAPEGEAAIGIAEAAERTGEAINGGAEAAQRVCAPPLAEVANGRADAPGEAAPDARSVSTGSGAEGLPGRSAGRL
jgi:hypothetical protein